MSPAGPSSGPAAENVGLGNKSVELLSVLPEAAAAAAASKGKSKSKGKALTAAVAPSSASSRTVSRLRGFKWRRALGSCWGSGNTGGSDDGLNERQQSTLPPLQPAGSSGSPPTAVATNGSTLLPTTEVATNGSPPLPTTVTRKLTALQLGEHDSAMLLDELLGATTHVIHCAAR